MMSDNTVLTKENLELANIKHEEWKITLEQKELRVSRSKTMHIECNLVGSEHKSNSYKINNDIIGGVNNFKYLELFVLDNGDFEDMKHRLC